MLKNYSNRQDQHDDVYEHDVYDLCVVYMATKQKPECTCFQFGIKRSETWHMTIEQRTIETGTSAAPNIETMGNTGPVLVLILWYTRTSELTKFTTSDVKRWEWNGSVFLLICEVYMVTKQILKEHQKNIKDSKY